MRFLQQFGVCDCHSHVFGPFATFPLSPTRTFDPPEAPIEQLEAVWNSMGIDRAVLVQGSAHGDDPAAMLAAIARSPQTRRGIALLSHTVSTAKLTALHQSGIRGVRFNWVSHLLRNDSCSREQRLLEAGMLLENVEPLGWHAEFHIDTADLHLLEELEVPPGMPMVIDHMARMDVAASDASRQLEHLLEVLSERRFWVKLSGADRITTNADDLHLAVAPMQKLVAAAPDRCVWGLDWPHVNLQRKRPDIDLASLLPEVLQDEHTLKQVLIHNPEKLYGFPPVSASPSSTTGD